MIDRLKLEMEETEDEIVLWRDCLKENYDHLEFFLSGSRRALTIVEEEVDG